MSTTHEVVSQILQKSLRRVKEVWNNADGTTIFDLKRIPCRVYPFELYFNSFLMCAWLCFYFLSLFRNLSLFSGGGGRATNLFNKASKKF